jgi:hypothetical protein
MPRINVEDWFWMDVMKVAVKVGDIDKASGNALRFIKFAQERYRADKTISEKDFQDEGFLEALIPVFAKRTDTGIIAVGAEKHFQWLTKKKEAGRKGAKKTNEKRWKDKSNQAVISTNQHSSAKISTNQHSSPSISISSSISNSPSISNSKNYSVGEAEKPLPTADENVKRFVGSFITGFQAKFNTRPDLSDKKLLGQLKTYSKNHPDIERACAMIQVFFQMDDSWFEKKSWDFSTFLANTQKVALALDTGQQVKPKDGADKWLDKQKKGSKEISA